METITIHLDKQHTLGHITGTDFATVYLGSIQSALTESMKFVLQRRASEKNEAVLEAQEALYKRQRAGFDDNKYQKVLDTQMNAWGITFQDTDTTFIPDEISKTEFNNSFTAARKDYYEE